jgi:hypothetical protein
LFARNQRILAEMAEPGPLVAALAIELQARGGRNRG